MFVKCNSTRHTVIGTLRRNHVYRLDDKSPKARKVVKTLTTGKRPVLSELSEDEAEKIGARAIGLVYSEDLAPSEEDAEAPALIEALTSQIEELTRKLDAAGADREKVVTERDALAGAVDEQKAATEELSGKLEASTAKLEEVTAERDALAKQIADLSAAQGADKA
ncbi:hypothetical protein [Salipiger abyssi]|uniref:hypothetical protein n=1 Tax=Salipiger abyssi TaxID=1250539 RepID=UPI001A9092CF|nr:hypothetical protein [Salipiger abyssi]MBN9890114.1 hypothetical protein [Salipiger abyssi]